MSNQPKLICLITPGHLTSTPRLLKEADALVGAGYRVQVVAGRHYRPVDSFDEQVLADAAWMGTRVDCRRGPGALGRKLLRRLARALLRRGWSRRVSVAARAHHAEVFHLAGIAAASHADFYLGHCLAGLAAAARAAARNGVPWGFDAEDFHDEETSEAMENEVDRAAARILQSHYLPRCRHLTAASPLIAARYAQNYGVRARPVLNVFPRSQAPDRPASPTRAGQPRRLYWFSQTIGPGRGLERVLAVMARMNTPCELHLRGFAQGNYLTQLAGRAHQLGLRNSPVILPPGPAREMARLAANADLGLSTEESAPPNRDLCLTNKIFVYLLAGVPQLLSDTTAQRALAPELGAAGLLCDLAQPEHTARRLDEFFAAPERVAAARQTAWNLGQTRYCWDTEQEKFLASIRGVVAPGKNP